MCAGEGGERGGGVEVLGSLAGHRPRAGAAFSSRWPGGGGLCFRRTHMALPDRAPFLLLSAACVGQDVHGDNLSGAQFALPAAEEVLAAVPASGKGQQVLKQLMERCGFASARVGACGSFAPPCCGSDSSS